MTIRQIGIFLRPLVIFVLILSFGCAQQMKSVQTEPVAEISATALIQSIKVADDASRIEIVSDRTIVYTYYMLESPPRVIVDIAQTAPGAQPLPLLVNRGGIRQIDITKHEFGSGVLSRIDITLDAKAEISASLDQQDKKKLILSIQRPVVEGQDAEKKAKPEQVKTDAAVPKASSAAVAPVMEAAPIVESKPVTADNSELEKSASKESAVSSQGGAEAARSETVREEPVKALPQVAEPVKAVSVEPVLLAGSAAGAVKNGEKALTAIKKDSAGLILEFSAEPDSFKAFKLTQPDRLVVDVLKARSAVTAKLIDIQAFNLGKVRIGAAADKLRLVFDATGTIPPYSVSKNAAGLFIAFGEGVKRHDSAKVEAPPMFAPPLEPVVPSAGAVTAAVDAGSAPKDAPISATVAVEPPSVAAPIEAATQAKNEAALPVSTESADAGQVAVKAEKVAEIIPPVPVTAPIIAESPAVAPSAVAPVVAAPVVAAPKPVSSVKPAVKKNLPGVIEAIEFTQAEGVSRITIRKSGNCSAGEPVKTAKGYSLSFKGCLLPVKLQRQLDTRGFDSAIKSIAPFSVKGGAAPEARLAVNLRSPLPNTLNKDADTVQWDFKEPVKRPKAAKSIKVPKASTATLNVAPQPSLDTAVSDVKQEQPKSGSEKAMEDAFMMEKASQPVTRQGKSYSGRKVTLEFSDADIKKIFQLLAEVSNQNILVSDDVSGTISLKLVNVPWDQALDVILENKGLGMQKDGNIVQIRPRTKMKSLDDEAVEMRLTEEKKMPLSTVIFDINFADLAGIETQFKNLKSKRSDSSISTDTRTNKIIVVDIDPNINKMRKLLDQLDIPEKQVMIEARIVEASSSFARDIGVKWNFGFQDGSASIASINNVTGSMGGVVTSGLSGSTGGITTGISFGKLLSNIQLDMRLSAASTVGQIKIISTPKVLTVNNKPAKISQGQMIPYQNTTSQDGAKTEFIEAALSLEVTPHITADGSVNMKIKASNNTAGVGSPPPINKKEATTELVVRNGETTVIGGIYVDSETEGDTGVPYLSDIPLLGWLFKSNSKSKSKNEMLIFITPKIMN